MQKIKEMVDVNTIISDPITTPAGTVVVPVSKVTYGFASGGSDLPTKKDSAKDYFGGGSGAGVSVVPMGFLVIGAEGNVTLLDLKNPDSYTPKQNPIEKLLDGANALMDRAPDMIAKCKDAFGKKQETQETQETEEN